MSSPRVVHVTDTALMVAAARAIETARADAIVRDPLAERLAGLRGMALAGTMTSPEWMGLGVGLRCREIDDMLLEAIAAEDIRTVVLLGAGLDTRPWRLALPPALRWIEVDFADMLDYKDKLLAGEPPRCRRERIATDLTDPKQRQAVFAAAGPEPGLMITEGLLLYLPAATTQALATESVRLSGIRHWLLDIAASSLMRNAHQGKLEDVEQVRAKDRVEGRPILDLAERTGWSIVARSAYAAEGFAIAAARGLPVLPDPEPATDDPCGIYRLTHSLHKAMPG